jgi:hypothetical protein
MGGRALWRSTVVAALACAALAPQAHAAADGLFAPGSYRNKPLAATAPIDIGSKGYVADLVSKVGLYGSHVNTTEWSTPVYEADGSELPRTVGIHHNPAAAACLTAGPNPPQSSVCLQTQWTGVPLPAGAQAAAGGSWSNCDCNLVVYQPPPVDTLWEFWRFRYNPTTGRPEAQFGGRIQDVSENPGHFTNPPGTGFGATATGIPLLAGLQRISELQAGVIDHAVNLVVPMVRSGVHRWPAQRDDGTSFSPFAVQEGMRFRLPASLDLDSLDLTSYGKVLARAVQDYGMVVTDQTGHRSRVTNGAIFYAEQPKPGEPNPYPAIFDGLGPDEFGALKNFPWGKLQVLAP